MNIEDVIFGNNPPKTYKKRTNVLDKVTDVGQKFSWKGRDEFVVQITTGNEREIKTYLQEEDKVSLISYTKLSANSWNREIENSNIQGNKYDEAIKFIKLINNYGAQK